ncbi:DUF2007 domain-containing protein [Marinobacterium aestuariivivens]|uniref:DUF2007 domain-containing protein n=1 Tax=Marinobacterium aestuariivivens TaxID=1698799 RepID=A0ABW2A0R1_9GAMM
MLLTAVHYDFPWEAQLARSRLEAEGIDAFVADEHTIGMQWLYSNALGGVRVQVDAEDLHRARAILAEDRSEDIDRQTGADPLICPCCGSDRTRYRPVGRRLAFLVFIGLDFPLFPVRHAVQCDDCGALSRLYR